MFNPIEPVDPRRVSFFIRSRRIIRQAREREIFQLISVFEIIQLSLIWFIAIADLLQLSYFLR